MASYLLDIITVNFSISYDEPASLIIKQVLLSI